MDNENRADRVRRVSSLFSQTAGAHRQYEIEQMGGERDEEWAKWYARYLTENGLFDLLGTEAGERAENRLQESLVRLDQHHRAHDADAKWEDYYARYLIKHGL